MFSKINTTTSQKFLQLLQKQRLGFRYVAQVECKTQKRIGSYVLIERIGEGQSAVVYKAYDPAQQRYVALKELKPQTDPRAFIREAALMAELQHRNIVVVQEVLNVRGHFYLVMQYITGRNLKLLLKQQRLSPASSCKIIITLSQALSAIHQHNIIHRDIKPTNILISHHQHQPFLTDFGLAARIGSPSIRACEHGLVGTVPYMSPEQAQGRIAAMDARSDIYSLGAVFYEMLSGQPLVQGEDLVTMLHQVIHAPPCWGVSNRTSVPPPLRKIVMQCLHKNPAQRYPNARALRNDIVSYLQTTRLLARPSRTSLTKQFEYTFAGVLGLLLVLIISSGFCHFFQGSSPKAQLLLCNNVVSPKAKSLLGPAATTGVELLCPQIQQLVKNKHCYPPKLLQQLRQCVASGEQDAQFWLLLGRLSYSCALHQQDRPIQQQLLQQSLTCLRRALQLASHNGAIWFYMHRTLQRLERQEKAWQYLLTPASCDPDSVYGRLAQALSFYQQARKINEPEVRRLLAQQMLRAFTQAVELQPDFAWIYYYRARCYLEFCHDWQAAMRDSCKALRLDADLILAYQLRARLHGLVGQYQQALQDCQQGLQRDPGCLALYYQRGLIYSKMTRFQHALADFNNVLTLLPVYAPAYWQRGNIYFKMGDYQQAKADYDRCLKLGGHNVQRQQDILRLQMTAKHMTARERPRQNFRRD